MCYRIDNVARSANVPATVVLSLEKAKIKPERLLEHHRQILRIMGVIGLQQAERQLVFALMGNFPKRVEVKKLGEINTRIFRVQPRKMPGRRPTRRY
jgi:hypothetical protein